MKVKVHNAAELKQAIKDEEEKIIVKDPLASKIKLLAGADISVSAGMTKEQLVGAAKLADFPVPVMITLIITLGIACIVAMLLHYAIKLKKTKNGDIKIVLKRK